MMHQGELSRGQMQAWALNRYYYQSRIPIKDAIILSRSEDPDFRRAWRKRVVDHDGDSAQEGGIERWIRLAEAAGLDRQRVMHCDGVLPAIRYAVDAYLDLVRNRSFLEAVASSLTELFSRELIALRMDRLRQHYPWLSSGLDYFTERLHQAPEDARFALQYVTEHAHTRDEQELDQIHAPENPPRTYKSRHLFLLCVGQSKQVRRIWTSNQAAPLADDGEGSAFRFKVLLVVSARLPAARQPQPP
jgi:pyrroloquinoline-quinone synthase